MSREKLRSVCAAADMVVYTLVSPTAIPYAMRLEFCANLSAVVGSMPSGWCYVTMVRNSTTKHSQKCVTAGIKCTLQFLIIEQCDSAHELGTPASRSAAVQPRRPMMRVSMPHGAAEIAAARCVLDWALSASVQLPLSVIQSPTTTHAAYVYLGSARQT